MPTKTAILLIDCPDRKGIVASIVNFLVQQYDVNILNADQHQDTELGLFFMRVEFATETPGFSEEAFRVAFDPVAREFRMNWRIEFADAVQNIAIFVSHYLHCLADLPPTPGRRVPLQCLRRRQQPPGRASAGRVLRRSVPSLRGHARAQGPHRAAATRTAR